MGWGRLRRPWGAGGKRQGNRTQGDPRVPTLLPCHPRPYETTRRTRFPARFTKYLPLKAPGSSPGCHPERSEGSLSRGAGDASLRSA